MQLIQEGRKPYGKDFFLQELGWDERILPEDCGGALAEYEGTQSRRHTSDVLVKLLKGWRFTHSSKMGR